MSGLEIERGLRREREREIGYGQNKQLNKIKRVKRKVMYTKGVGSTESVKSQMIEVS